MSLPLQTEKQIWELLAQTLPMLQALHDQGRIHGDIKPAIFPKRLPPEPLDAVELEMAQVLELSGVAIGSAEYAAPEQLKGEAIAASDLYSLGLVCIYWLTGISPFDWLSTPSTWTAYLLEPISPSLERLLAKLTAPTVQERYQNVNEVFEAMALAGAALIPPNQAIYSNPGRLTQPHCVQILSGLTSAVHAVVIHPDGLLFSGTADGKIQRWSLATGELEEMIAAHSKPVTDLALSPSSAHKASSSDDRTVRLWEKENPTPIILRGHTHCIKAIAFSPDGTIIASGSWDKTIRLWPVLPEAPISILAEHRLGINALAFSPQGNFLASGGLDCEVLIWDWRSHQLLQRLSGHTHAVTALAFSPDGQTLATGSDDGTIRIWKRHTRQFSLKRTLSAHSWRVSSLVFSPTGAFLFSGSWDHTIKIWDIEADQAVAVLRGHTDSVLAIALDKSQKLLASSSRDQTIRLWEIEQHCVG
jgi:WD domain, G-beta repeat/Protein kinase domain